MADEATTAIEELDFRPTEAGAAWAHDSSFRVRASDLADHLRSALLLAERFRFASSYAVLRCALEHVCLDRLLLLSDTYRRHHGKMEAEDLSEQRAAFQRGEWPDEIIDVLRSSKGNITTIRKGYAVRNQDGEITAQISPYWPLLERYQPIVGPPNIQDKLIVGHTSDSDRQKVRGNADAPSTGSAA